MSFTLSRVDTLFPIPLYRYQVEEAGLNDRLSKEIAKRRKAEQGMVNRNRRGWQSEHDFFQRKEEGHIALARAIAQVMKATVLSLDPAAKFDRFNLMLNGWLNVNPPGGYNGPHQHTDAHLSGVYYVDVPSGGTDAGGAIEFLSPHPVRLIRELVKHQLFSERVRLQPKAGDLLVFPGQLPHWVHPNDSGKPRVTVAFNAVIQPKR